MQMEPILHLRACPAFPAKPLQPASDLLSQKGQPLYAHSYRFRRVAPCPGNVSGSCTQFPCSAKRSGVSHLQSGSRRCNKSRNTEFLCLRVL